VALATVLISAIAGLLAGGLVRYALDRRQELVSAQAFARVIHDELQQNEQLLERILESEIPLNAGAAISMTSWQEHRAAVAAQLLEEEFFALSSVYRYIQSARGRLGPGRRDGRS
jgi:hypothetical protein